MITDALNIIQLIWTTRDYSALLDIQATSRIN